MKTPLKLPALLALSFLLLPCLAQAWWNKDWKERTQIVLNTSSAGVETKDPVSGLAIPVRLHSGNFDFLAAKPDGSDLRLVAGDDKTPLKFWVERYDSVNELALVWVQVPSVLPGTDKNLIYAYAGNDQAPSADGTAAVFDDSTLAAFHFWEKDGIAADQSGAVKATSAVTLEPNGLIGPSARLTGSAITWPASDKLKAPASGPFSLSLWLRPDAAAGVLYSQGPLKLALNAGKLSATLGAVSLSGGDIAAARWSQVVLTIGGGKLLLYVDGVQAAQADLALTQGAPIEGDITIGDGYQGLIDEVQLASTARSADWIKVAYASQAADAKLVASKTESADSADSDEGSSPGYILILVKNLTPDAITVIGILFVMFLIAVWVMVTKAMFVRRAERANLAFMARFHEATDVLRLNLDGDSVGAAAVSPGAVFRNSPLHLLYQAGLRELTKRNVGQQNQKPLSGASLDAVKASIDADMVRENYKLNSRMVLLTIAIAGGPFLGLLGTVVGVMITFAAIAAAGDVNVNAIAPGIAAALLATVAGLAVAIPALFGYNYLASRIKLISSDMQIFVDEFVTRVAELYGAA